MSGKLSTLRCLIAAMTLMGAVAFPLPGVAQDDHTPAVGSERPAADEPALGLDEAIALALEHDEWLRASELREQAMRNEAVYAGQLPDPRMKLELANVPVDSFSLDHEDMTQVQVGVSQDFPAGATLGLSAEQKLEQSQQYPFLRQEREAAITLEVTGVWLDAFLTRELIGLHTVHRAFLEQLVEAADIRYTAAAGNARQQDLVLAQVELLEVDDRLIDLRRELNESRRALARWLPFDRTSLALSSRMPEPVEPETPPLPDLERAAEFFAAHPRVRAFDKELEAALTGVEIARQSYKPGFNLGAEYAKRFDGPGGLARSDFVSLSVTFDLPLFTEKRQKPRVEAAYQEASALQAERVLLIRELAADYQQALERLERLKERAALYDDILGNQLDTLTEASMSAYAAEEADFETVIQAYIKRHVARIEKAKIDVEQLKVIARLNYLMTGPAYQASAD